MRTWISLVLLTLWAMLPAATDGVAQASAAAPVAGATASDAPAPTQTRELAPAEIIRQFTEKESEFYAAWMNYSYTQTAQIRIRSVDGAPSKEWMTLVSEVVFNDDGSREIRQLSRKGKLQAVRFTPEDQEIIDNINPFALTVAELSLYDLKYEGKEKVDELNCYVFAVSPKKIKGRRMYFEGKIWVDDIDLQVVRTKGRAVPQQRDNLFPEFETLRQLIDGKYWFPVWTHADDRLQFPDKVVRIEQTITYDDYKKFATKANIQYGSPDAPSR